MAEGELLLEVRAEEIPARMLAPASRDLATRLFEQLVALGLTPREVEAGFTPRRLWVGLTGLGSAEMYEPWNSLAPSDIDPDRSVRGDQSRVTVPWAMPTTAAMAATSTTATTTHSKALKIRPWLRIRVST